MAHSINRVPPGGASFSLGDAWYALFRHKWKVVACTFLGMIAAVVVYVTQTPQYVSEAKLFIRYIIDNRAVEAPASEGQSRTAPSSKESNILNSEAEIIQSLDLCILVAESVGPRQVLAGTKVEKVTPVAAAGVLRAGLRVEPLKQSNVIKVRLAHSDPEIARLALQRLIAFYLRRHAEIHRGLGTVDTILGQQTDQIRTRLMQTDEQIRKLRTNAGVLSVEDTRRSYTEQIGSVRQMILSTEAELAEYHLLEQASNQTNATTNAVSGKVSPAGEPVSPAALGQYRAVLGRLESLVREELEKREVYTEGSRVLVRLREQIEDTRRAREEMEKQYPALSVVLEPPVGNRATPLEPVIRKFDPERVRALQAKMAVLKQKLDRLVKDGAALEELEIALLQLQRGKELDEKNYRHFSAGLEQNRFDQALGAGKLANISEVQSPTPAFLDGEMRMKMVAGALAAGVFGGIALALLIELMLDRSVRRLQQVETTLALPLLSTVPRVRLKPWKIPAKNDESKANGLLGWSESHPLREAIDGIRDRTMMHFDGDCRKPKLVGVTGCRDGVGASTVASLLAASLSETGEGQVLLVNLAPTGNSVYPFSFGKPTATLSEAVEVGSRSSALVGRNLYLANGNTDGNSTPSALPTVISRILPKIKVSEYDYVVFDMPPVSATSITSKLAGKIDLVFLVVESERDSQNALRRASHVLGESNATFRVVLNKFRSYVPKWLDHD